MLQTRLNYNKLIQDIQTHKYTQQETLALYRKLALGDLYFLNRYILGRADMENQWCYDRCMDVQQHPDNHVDIWFRGGYKSSIITISKTIQDILTNPLLTFNIFSFREASASSFVSAMANTFKMNDLLKTVFPEEIPTGSAADKWLTNSKISLNGRNFGRKEHNVQCSGFIEGLPVGAHFDYCIYDDVVTRDSVATKDLISKSIECYGLSRNLTSMIDKQRVIGTRYSYEDLFNHLQTMPSLTFREHKVYNDDRSTNLYSSQQVEAKRAQMGSWVFACQMMNEPINPETAVFQRSDMLLFASLPTDVDTEVSILVDPAISEKSRADKCVVMAVVTQGSDVFVDDYVSGVGMGIDATAAAIIRLARRYNKVRRIGIEMVAYQKALRNPVQEALLKAGLHIPVVELKADRAKRERILGLQPYSECHRLHCREHMSELHYEFDHYPAVSHDDHLDVLAYITQFMRMQQMVMADDHILNEYRREGINTASRREMNQFSREPVKWQGK